MECNVSNVIDMSYMFDNCPNFNSDLNNWNISNVKNTEYMFFCAKSFDCYLSNWNLNHIDRISYMFHGARNFNGNILKMKTNLKSYSSLFK